MSVSAIASLRPLRGQCLRNSTLGLLSIQVRSRSACVQLQAVIPLRPEYRRYQSNISSNRISKGDAEQENKQDQLPKRQQQQQQQITFRKFAGRALGAGLRSLVTALSPTGIKTAFRQSPGSTTFALLL